MRTIISSATVGQEGEDGAGCGMLTFTGKLYGVGLEVADLLGGHEYKCLEGVG